MIIWISGPYGVGKSTLAEAMADKMKNVLIFDAEEVGNAVRENYPDCPYGYIFEDYPLWGEFCYLLLKDVHEKFHKDILVPMTLLRKESYGIIEKLNRDGIDTRLVVLEASYQTVHDRILELHCRAASATVWRLFCSFLTRAIALRKQSLEIRIGFWGGALHCRCSFQS